MHREIIIAILKTFGLSVSPEASKTALGIEGRFSLVFKAFPVIGIAIFGLFGVLAIQDPDPHDQAVSVLGFGLVALCIGMTLHRFTFRIEAEGTQIRVTSLVVSTKVILLNDPFEAAMEEEGRMLTLRQGGQKIVIACTMTGYQDFFDLVARSRPIAGD